MKYLKIAYGFLLETVLSPVFIIQILLIILALWLKSEDCFAGILFGIIIYTISINLFAFIEYDVKYQYKNILPIPFFFRLWFLLKSDRFMFINNRFYHTYDGNLLYKGKVYRSRIYSDEALIREYFTIKEEKKKKKIHLSSHKIERR